MINKIELSEIPGRKVHFNNTVLQEVEQFYNSDWPACEVSIKGYKNCHSATAAYREAIKKTHLNVAAVERDGRLFLIRGKI